TRAAVTATRRPLLLDRPHRDSELPPPLHARDDRRAAGRDEGTDHARGWLPGERRELDDRAPGPEASEYGPARCRRGRRGPRLLSGGARHVAEDARAAGLVPQLGNILDKLPKRLQPHVKAALHDVIHAETRGQAREAVTQFATEYGPKYPKAVTTPEKDADVLLTFFDFPAEHWKTDGQSVAGRTRPALHTDPNRVAVRSSARCRFKRPARKDHMAKVTLRTSDQRLQAGKSLRGKCPRLSHGKVGLGQGDKRDVVALIKASNEDRLEIRAVRTGRLKSDVSPSPLETALR